MPHANELKEHLDRLDSAYLTPMVRRLLGDERVGVTEWGFEPVCGGLGGRPLYRFQILATNRMRCGPGRLS